MATQTLYHISHVSNEHSEWMRASEFYIQEIQILENRLSEVSQRYTRDDVKADVEHYQNQFIIQRANFEDLIKDIKTHEIHMSDDAEKKALHLSNTTLAEHDAMRERFQHIEKFINNLRHDFNKFLSRYM